MKLSTSISLRAQLISLMAAACLVQAAMAIAGSSLSTDLFYILMGIGVVISLAGAVWFSRSLSARLVTNVEGLVDHSKRVLESAVTISAQSEQLSEASSSQAASLQETMAAVHQISSMVQKNSEAAGRVRDLSHHSRESAERGREMADGMLQVMSGISGSYEEVSYQLNDSNQRLFEIAKVISEIGNKTKVINEIVFQTKLLSFNASVEAARAGEAGKGFAVVGQEVGSLAEMSGKAAKEITDMLQSSIVRVEAIAEESQIRVDGLRSEVSVRLKQGKDSADESLKIMSAIIENVVTVDQMVTEIAQASAEQSTGINEISTAITRMEMVTEQNAKLSKDSASTAVALKSQISIAQSDVECLVQIIEGKQTDTGDSKSPKVYAAILPDPEHSVR